MQRAYLDSKVIERFLTYLIFWELRWERSRCRVFHTKCYVRFMNSRQHSVVPSNSISMGSSSKPRLGEIAGWLDDSRWRDLDCRQRIEPAQRHGCKVFS